MRLFCSVWQVSLEEAVCGSVWRVWLCVCSCERNGTLTDSFFRHDFCADRDAGAEQRSRRRRTRTRSYSQSRSLSSVSVNTPHTPALITPCLHPLVIVSAVWVLCSRHSWSCWLDYFTCNQIRSDRSRCLSEGFSVMFLTDYLISCKLLSWSRVWFLFITHSTFWVHVVFWRKTGFNLRNDFDMQLLPQKRFSWKSC